jgi:glycosyltransferase involved in cell wall biosynthesis
MKIASIYNFRAYPPKGGNHLHALQLIRQFQAAGHQVLTWGDDTAPRVRAYPRDTAGGEAMEAEADVLYVRLDGNRLQDDGLLVRLIEKTSKPMVWEINSPADETLAFSWLGGGDNRWPAPVDRAKRRFHAWRQSHRIEREDRLRRRLAGKVSTALCVSDGVARYAREALAIADVRVVPNGADPDTHQPIGPRAELPESHADHLNVLYAGSPTYPWQGLGIVEQTIELCARHRDPLRFVLLFNQPSSRLFDKSNTVVFQAVPHDRVGEYIRACDVALALLADFWWSPWGSYFSPMKAFDYMACGRPVVASRVGQLEQIIEPGRNGELFDNTPEDLRSKLLALAQDREKLARMGLAAREDIVQTYNWKNVGKATLEALQQAVG